MTRWNAHAEPRQETGVVKSLTGNIGEVSYQNMRMKAKQGFPDDILKAICTSKILRVSAGTQGHCFIGIWAVVIEGRVFVRSWSLKPRSWYRTFLKEPRGAIQIAGREIPVSAVHTRSGRLKDAVDRAYLEKYNTPASIKYARNLAGAKCRATTTELAPLR